MAPGAFTFVNRTGKSVTSHEEDEDLPTIRSHAMREVRRLKGLASGKSPPTNAKVRLSKTTTAKDSDRSWNSVPASKMQHMSWDEALSGTYCGTAIELDKFPADDRQHLHYFLHGFTPLTFPTARVRYECDILRIALSEGNAALLQALCAVGSIHRALAPEYSTLNEKTAFVTNTHEMRRAFLYHKQCAIILLQTNLSKPVLVQRTSSLATVALLLMLESLSGDIATANAHRSGLLELTKRCGNTLSDLMVSDLLMSDIKSATSSLSRPSIRLCDDWLSRFDELKHLPFVPHRSEFASLGSGFIGPQLGYYLGPALELIMCAMRNLINALEKSFDCVSDIDGAQFLVLEHQLLSYHSSTNRTGMFSVQLTECCRIGALLYCNLCLWSWPKNATLVHNLVFRLRAVISQCTTDLYDYEQCRVLLWLYFMGSFAGTDGKHRQWYTNGMRVVSKWLHVGDEEHFRSLLACQFYVHRLMAQHLKNSYIEMSRKS